MFYFLCSMSLDLSLFPVLYNCCAFNTETNSLRFQLIRQTFTQKKHFAPLYSSALHNVLNRFLLFTILPAILVWPVPCLHSPLGENDVFPTPAAPVISPSHCRKRDTQWLEDGPDSVSLVSRCKNPEETASPQ